MTRRLLSRGALLLAIAAIIVFKLWLIQGETIVGSATQYDALWYLRSARHWYWGAIYDWIAFIRPCAYPLWIAAMRLLHLPLRLAIELWQFGGALTLALAFRGLGVNRWFCVASVAVICLHPIGFQQNNYTMSDTFYAAMLWYVLGGMLLSLARPGAVSQKEINRPKARLQSDDDARDSGRREAHLSGGTRRGESSATWVSLGTGLAIAILWNTREEGIVLLALVALWVVLLRNFRLIVTTCATAVLLIAAVYGVNDWVFRSFARSEMTAPLFQSFYHSLLRIKPAEAKPYAPITMDTLQRAFAVSPTLAKLRQPLNGPMGEAWRMETLNRVGTPNEIGVGWIVWATRQAAAIEGIFASPKAARRFFAKATKEINRACDEGRLPTRFVLDGFLDPFTQSGAQLRLPNSIGRVAKRAFARWPIRPIADDSVLTKEETELYDQMTLRRALGMAPRRGAAFIAEQFTSRYHWVAMVMLHALALGAVVYLLFSKTRATDQRGIIYAIALLAGTVLLRAALLAWLDATAFDATQDRFLFPILPLWSVVLVLTIALATQARRQHPTPGNDER